MTDPKSCSLLARLNALRPTPITLNPSTPSFHSASDTTTDPTTAPATHPDTETDLAARFARLNGTSQLDCSQQHHIAEEDTEYPTEDEPTLDELLHELQSDSSWQVDASDKNEARNLVAEARLALSAAAQVQREQEQGDGHDQVKNKELMEKGNDEIEIETRQPTEDEEADEYIQQALAAAALEGPDDDDNDNDNENEEEHANVDAGVEAEFTLPSAPTTLHAPAQANNDTASFFELPSAPTSVPTTKTVTSGKPASSKPPFPDDEIETWCIICLDDATVRCLGCEGDLYCSNCWNEGHRGPDAGFEEKTHKAVRFVKPSSQPQGKVGKGRRMVGAA